MQYGDPAAPLISSLVLAGLALAAQNICPDVKQTLFVDDRTLTGRSRGGRSDLVATCTRIWIEKRARTRCSFATRRIPLVGHGTIPLQRIIISVVGGQSTEQHAKETARWEKDKQRRRRVRLLPRSYLGRLSDTRQFALPTVSFGWIRDLPPQKQVTKRDRHMWSNTGRLAASAPDLRSFTAGSTTELALAIRWIRLDEVGEVANRSGTQVAGNRCLTRHLLVAPAYSQRLSRC